MIDFASKGSNDVKSYPVLESVFQSDEDADDEQNDGDVNAVKYV